MQEQANENDCFLLVHTMTITEIDYVVQAQFFHAFSRDLSNARLVGKRMRLKIHSALRGGRNKTGIQRQCLPNLKVLMKRNPSNIRHHLRAVHMYVFCFKENNFLFAYLKLIFINTYSRT